jgi:hypothetical protein
MNSIKESIYSYVDRIDFSEVVKIDGLIMLEVQRLVENIISKPYQDWMFREKTKIRCNFAEDAKRT